MMRAREGDHITLLAHEGSERVTLEGGERERALFAYGAHQRLTHGDLTPQTTLLRC
jgi:hypothetical protein